MRITNIVTADQRQALSTAGIAARLIVERLDGAELAEFSSEDNEDKGVFKYRLLNVWGAGQDGGERYNTREHLWCNDAERGPNHGLSVDDVLRIETVIRAAGDLDVNVFGVDELVEGVFDFDLAAIIEVAGDDAVDRLVLLIEEIKMDEVDLDDLLETAAAPPNGEPAELPDEVMDGTIADRARYLIARLGEDEAFAAVRIHHA